MHLAFLILLKILATHWDLFVYTSVDLASYFIQLHSTLIQVPLSAGKALSVKYVV